MQKRPQGETLPPILGETEIHKHMFDTGIEGRGSNLLKLARPEIAADLVVEIQCLRP